MESLESTHRELDSTAERLRTVEAQVMSVLWGCGSLSEGISAQGHRRRQCIGFTIVKGTCREALYSLLVAKPPPHLAPALATHSALRRRGRRKHSGNSWPRSSCSAGHCKPRSNRGV